MSAEWFNTLPDGYTLREPAKLARSTRSRFTRAWYFMLRDLYEDGGYGWQRWGSGHMSSGITKALTARRYIETAESSKAPLLFRLTRAGEAKLMELYEERAEWAEKHGDEYIVPEPPEGAPRQPLRQPEPPKLSYLEEAQQVLNKAEVTYSPTGRRSWAACGHPSELDIDNHCYTCHEAVAP